ncbi:hypothetical protein ECP030230812_5129 [Escherichia coli P0302308.12]|nr:hypothetical protein ECP030230812_5129 [Escherichia coli P0302308.12]
MHRLDEVVDTLLVLQKKHRIRFDVWQVVKRDHAIISFFDQGMNPAVPRVAYWTPFRYPLLLNLASLFDNELAEKAWRARLEAHDGRSSSLFSEVCSELLARVHTLGDRRYIELITDALSWAMTHFDELGYNCKTGKQKLQIMPNMVGFQFVLRGICSRLVYTNRNTGRTDSVSLQSVAKRSKEFLDKLQEPTAEMMKKAREYRDQEEARRLEHRGQILPPS